MVSVSALPLPASVEFFSNIRLLFNLEDGGNRFLLNVGNRLRDYTASDIRIPSSSYSRQREPQISYTSINVALKRSAYALRFNTESPGTAEKKIRKARNEILKMLLNSNESYAP
jgi:hypothetical protein